MDAFTGFDRVGLFLSGGAGNVSPSGSLGGAISTKLIRGMAAQYIDPVQALVIEDATPENGEGVGEIVIVGDAAQYTPPNGAVGELVEIAEGVRAVLQGADPTKAVRIYRVPDQIFTGIATFRLLDQMNGVLSMANLVDADRVAGATHYRAIFIKALGDVEDIEVWIDAAGQAEYSVAAETPVASVIQATPDGGAAPSGVVWVDAIDEVSAISLGDLTEGEVMGLWLRRTFPPAGAVAAHEAVNFNISFRGRIDGQ